MLIDKHIEFLEYKGIPIKKITKGDKDPYYIINKGLLFKGIRFHSLQGLHDLIDQAINNVNEKKRLKEERKKKK